MQLDSKESDIEQLRRKIMDLQQGMDSTSVASLPTDETDGNLSGKRKAYLNYLALLHTHRFGRYCFKQLLLLQIFWLSNSVSHLHFLSLFFFISDLSCLYFSLNFFSHHTSHCTAWH